MIIKNTHKNSHDKACIAGIGETDYDGGYLFYEGDLKAINFFDEMCDSIELFNYCPICGKKLENN